jgi:hypothetical protein
MASAAGCFAESGQSQRLTTRNGWKDIAGISRSLHFRSLGVDGLLESDRQPEDI